jgi:nitrate/TMAO reductase-like tetraheme cytochrome c subunit
MKQKILILLLLIGVVIGLVLSYVSYEAITRTGTAQFCVICHEMAPMRASFDQDVHGGNGKTGIRANCVDCHLPHNNLMNYIFTKAKNGSIEVGAHFFGNVDTFDWQNHREERAKFVFDDGCKKCHTNYTTNEKFSAKARQMHQHYNALIGTDKELGCASCHAEVGHNGLNNMLNIYKPEHPLYEKGAEKEKLKINEKLYGKGSIK